MNMQAIQINPAANAAKESAARSRVAESGDGETSFRDVLKGEVAERRQAEADVPPVAGKTDRAAPKVPVAASSETVRTTQEKDEAEPVAETANSEDMTHFLVLTSQFVQPVANPDAAVAVSANDMVSADSAAAAAVAVATMPDAPVIAQGDTELPAVPFPMPQQAGVAQPQLQADKSARADMQAQAEHPDFAAQLDQARMAQQPVPGALPDKSGQQAGSVAEALSAAAQTTEMAGDVQQPATGFVALQQAVVEQAERLADPSTNRIAPRVATPAWNQAVGQKIVWMAGNEQQSASLTLNPPDLGPLQVVIRVSESMATANFVSAHPEVRQALEAAMPRLREMLGEAGIQLGQAHVGAGTSGEYGARAQQQLAQPAFSGIETSLSLQPDMPQPVQVIRRGLVDTFA